MKKRPKNVGSPLFIWIAVDRESSKVIDFEIGDRSNSAYLKLALE